MAPPAETRSFRGGSLLAILLVGLGVRLAIAGFSFGSDDVHIWARWAELVTQDGLLGRYGEMTAYGFPMNHPPTAVGLVTLMHDLSAWTGLPFALALKLPMILADCAIGVLVALVVAREAGASASLAAAVAYAFSPIALLISAYHGNTDCLAASLGFAAAVLMTRDRPGAAGLALGAALNVKLIPVLLLPVLFLQIREWGAARRFTLGFAVALLPFLPFVVAQPLDFYQATLGYRSELTPWGMNAFFLAGAADPALESTVRPLMQTYRDWGTPLMLALIGGLAIGARLRPRWNAIELGGAAMALFLTIPSGFCVQYLIYVLPFLVVLRSGPGLAYSLFGGAFTFVVYWTFWTGTLPLESRFQTGFHPAAQAVGLIAWALLIGWLVWIARRGFGADRGAVGAPALAR